MPDKNLHDIKIDELDSPKKTPLKNILTLLALLFIILVISVVITKLILNTDEGSTIENNNSTSELFTNKEDTNKTTDGKEDETTKNVVPTISSNITERNLTSAIKVPLSSHRPKEMTTYTAPKKNNSPKEVKEVVKKTTVIKKKPTQAKQEYIDKVVVKRNTASTSNKTKSSFLGGKRKNVTNSYYIKVGTYRDATAILKKVKKNNFNYAIVKVENDKTLLRVMVGPFFSRNQANAQLAKVKANILSGAYVTKAK
jgi:cell division septation protein DedD